MMKKILSILIISVVSLSSYAQTEAGFLKDAKNNFVKVGVSSTDFKWSPFPPDTIISFDVTMVNPGDESTPSLADGVQAYWSFEETAGAVAFDSTVNNYDGDLENTPTIMQTGISNYCYDFDYASSEWIDFGTSFWDVGTDDLSVALWFKLTGATNYGGLIGIAGAGTDWYIRAQTGNYLKGTVDFGGGNIETFSNSNNTLTDVWYHIVYQLDRDGTTKLYINNILQTDQDDISASVAVDMSSGNNLGIGNIGNGHANYFHNGLIDEVSVYDRLLSEEEISNLYNVGVGKFWPYGVSGGDTLNMTNVGFDPRGDSVIVLWKYTGWPTDEEDGTVQFAFPMLDSALYNDTNFVWAGRGDTIVYFTAFTGLDDVWTLVPNKDTVFIDSSDIYPPIQDVGVWDSVFYQNFEQHSGIAPTEYTSSSTKPVGTRPNLQGPDWEDVTWFDSDVRYPGWWQSAEGRATINDSIVIDVETGSIVLKESFQDTTADGYCGNGPNRGGDSWRMPLPDGPHDELYVSFNIQFRQGFDWAYGGGKLGGGVRTNFEHGADPLPPEYGAGFTNEPMFTSGQYSFPNGGIHWYTVHQGTTGPYASVYLWDEFQPAGTGLNYDANGAFYFDVTGATWYNVTLRYVVNSFTGVTPNSDGLMEGFINGRLVSQQYGYIFLTYPDRNKGIEDLFWRTFWGGGCGPGRDEWILYDDIYIFTYDVSVDVPRGQELSSPGRVLNLPGWPKEEE